MKAVIGAMLSLVVMSVALVAFSSTSSALTIIDCERGGIPDDSCGTVTTDELNYESGASRVWTVIQFVLGVLGGIAIIMIVIGGLKYTLSNGDSSQLNSAKNTILYSVIGLVVAMLASAIVLFVRDAILV